MATYRVELTMQVNAIYEVEADNKENAEEEAIRAAESGETPDDMFDAGNIKVINVEKMED